MSNFIIDSAELKNIADNYNNRLYLILKEKLQTKIEVINEQLQNAAKWGKYFSTFSLTFTDNLFEDIETNLIEKTLLKIWNEMDAGFIVTITRVLKNSITFTISWENAIV